MIAPTLFGGFREKYENDQPCTPEMMVLGGGDISYFVHRAAWEVSVLNSSLASGDLRVKDISCGAQGTVLSDRRRWDFNVVCAPPKPDHTVCASVEGTPGPWSWPAAGDSWARDVSLAAFRRPRPGGGCRPQRGQLPIGGAESEGGSTKQG